MYKVISLLFFVLIIFVVQAQQVDQKGKPVLKSVSLTDSTKKALSVQDTIKKESRRERKKREKAEEEAKKPKIFKDSTRLAIEAKTATAWKRSLILPGWGQYTNKGLWWLKVPIIYGGFTSTVLVFDFNNRYYKELITELDYRYSNNGAVSNPLYAGASTEGLISAKDYARRNRDLMVLLTVGWYGLNVVEAYVDSMLKNRWNVSSEKIGFTIRPTILQGPTNRFAYNAVPNVGLKLSMHIK
ncbi:DUF5683 domain-containing protein [Sphingobacterium sp. SRCM116780]|uniref:DUF5683 domain-containing protein n=1 Tax=Sphingobacterium sp. SRCM116780 TaxID=2907623 RepID=UPI001F21F817|nr:DUF5683 domain-containing protein [Sphingobacterium sp. SRCM116780]UIR56103.1 DUF5683 domain-containing protein [Sphingobacterium sp. SRCM116780]